MTIPNLPLLDRFSPTFRSDVDAFFGGQIQATINAINPEIERINQIGAGSFTATSSTSLTVGTGTINLTIDTGKGFAPGQAVIVARTASPADFMAGQVVSYDAGTGAMVVNATTSGGSGTHSGWTVSVTAIVSALELDSIIVLTSGTSWTVPAGVRKVVGYVEGASGGGMYTTSTGSTGAGGGGVKFLADVTPGDVCTYSIGAGGLGGTSGSPAGGDAGATSITINGKTYTASGGMGATTAATVAAAAGHGSGPAGSLVFYGEPGNISVQTFNYSTVFSRAAFGIGRGGMTNANTPAERIGDPGRIILELYK